MGEKIIDTECVDGVYVPKGLPTVVEQPEEKPKPKKRKKKPKALMIAEEVLSGAEGTLSVARQLMRNLDRL